MRGAKFLQMTDVLFYLGFSWGLAEFYIIFVINLF